MKRQKESKIFDLKPQLTLAMKLAATFAMTYYGLLFLLEVFMLVMNQYSIDSYYLGEGEVLENRSMDFVYLIIQLILSGLMIFSLILIFLKKTGGKAFFVGFSILLIAFQLYVATLLVQRDTTTYDEAKVYAPGILHWMKYALEVLMVLIIAPIRVKKKVKIKGGKITLEDSSESPENPAEEPAPDTVQEPQGSAVPSSNSEPVA